MATQFNVAGYSTLWVGSSELGICDDSGVELSFTTHYEELFTDEGGSFVASEVSVGGQTCTITCNLLKYDAEILDTIKGGGTGTTLGENPQVGDLMFACNKDFTFDIRNATTCSTSTNTERGWYFKRCLLDAGDSRTMSVGHKATRQKIVVKCFPDADGVIFTRS